MSVHIILIPAYKAPQNLLDLITALLKEESFRLIVVNDGSAHCASEIFNRLAHWDRVIVLNHDKNLGKGQALKSGINFALLHHKNSEAIITADCDGQHLADDIIRVALTPGLSDKCLVLGTRSFASANTPVRSWLGNAITRGLMFALMGVRLKDTQTGLRAFTPGLAAQFLELRSQRYDYEMEMLISCIKMDIDIKEIPIATIYTNNNQSSHFKPIKDSFSVVLVLARWLLCKTKWAKDEKIMKG